MMDENAPSPWHERGFQPVSEVLAKAGLPENMLEQTGLVYLWQPYRRSHGWKRLSYSAKQHVFSWGAYPWTYVVKHGHEEAFISQVRRILAGKEHVVRYAPHVAAMRALSEGIRTERALRHASHTATLDTRFLRPVHVLSAEDLEKAAHFLKAWEIAGRDPNLHPNHIPVRTTLYANGLQSLFELDLSRWERESILEKLKPGNFVKRLHSSTGGLSGLWIFERPLPRERVTIRIALCLFQDEPPRCEHFAIAHDEPLDHPAPMPLDLQDPAGHEIDLAVDGLVLRTWVLAFKDRSTEILYSNIQQTDANAYG